MLYKDKDFSDKYNAAFTDGFQSCNFNAREVKILKTLKSFMQGLKFLLFQTIINKQF